MYYGGTVIEVALVAVVMAQWYLVSGRALGPDPAQVAERGATASMPGGFEGLPEVVGNVWPLTTVQTLHHPPNPAQGRQFSREGGVAPVVHVASGP